jgi:hypothetical protein
MKAVSIDDLWRDHVADDFPPECRGAEIDGVDLVLLDSFIAGCVDTFLANDRDLDQRRTAVLRLSLRDAALAVRTLDGAASLYYARLELLAALVLAAVRDRSPAV